MQKLELGSGLIRIGRVWGAVEQDIPTQGEALTFLTFAFSLGIRFFDTAPAYGLSEERLGLFLQSLTDEERNSILVATKCGEHWDKEKGTPYVDHSYDALVQSIDQSLARLGTVDILQLHKASAELLEDEAVMRAFEYARSHGITRFGASVSDIEAGLKACELDAIEFIQLPYNQERQDLLPVIVAAETVGKKILFNRPLAMGATAQVQSKTEKENAIVEAFSFIAEPGASGYVLSGTGNSEHLKENMSLFAKATK